MPYGQQVEISPNELRVCSSKLDADHLFGTSLEWVYQIWQAARQERAMPTWRDIGFDQIPAILLPYMALVDVNWAAKDGSAPTYIYRFFGSAIRELHGCDSEAKQIDQVRPAQYSSHLVQQYNNLISAGEPLYSEIMLDCPSFQPCVMRNLRLPLSGDGERVDQVLTLYLPSTRYQVFAHILKRYRALDVRDIQPLTSETSP